MPRFSLRYFLRAFALLAGALIALPAHAGTATTEFQLGNGLKVVVREDHRAPVVVVQVWYRVGSSYEAPGLTGLSHALEHMMFKGTAKVPNGEFSRIVAQYGGEDNAFTTDDYTAYYQLYAADKLPLALELEADRMNGLQLNANDFTQEIRVIMEERRMRTDDNPQSLARERFNALAYLSSASRTPTIGWMSDLQRMNIENLRQWYATWYAPNNATLVIVGDVNPAAVKKLVAEYFAALPAKKLPTALLPLELAAPGERKMRLNLPAKVPALFMGFNVPSVNTGAAGAAEALSMLMGVLDGGVSARLETRLVRDLRVAAAINSGYDEFARGDALFVVTAVPAPGRSMSELEEAVLAELEKIKTENISADELNRVYAGMVSSAVFQRDSIEGQANSIGALESVGQSWRMEDEWPLRLKKITPDAIRAAAVTYLTPARRTILQLLPEEKSAETAAENASAKTAVEPKP